MATTYENEGKLVKTLKKKGDQEMYGNPIPKSQEYLSHFHGDNNSSSDKEYTSLHEYATINNLVDGTEKTSDTHGASVLGSSSVKYEQFSDVLRKERTEERKPELQTTKQQASIYTDKGRQFILMIIIVLIVCVFMNTIAGFVIEGIISQKLTYEKTTESRRIEQLKRDAEWNDWTDWGRCSMSCDLGLRSRDRKCMTQSTIIMDGYCNGSSHQDQICIQQHCADGGWGLWGPWGPCSVTCGVGIRKRSRQCDNPTPSEMGAYCLGLPVEADVCLVQECSVNPSLNNGVNTTACSTNTCKGPLVYFSAHGPDPSRHGSPTFHASHGDKNFNKTTGKFTCQVAGLYYFTVNIIVRSGEPKTFCYIRCRFNDVYNDRSYTVTSPGQEPDYYGSASGSAYCQLNVNDQAFLQCFYMSSVDRNNNAAFFTGALITPS